MKLLLSILTLTLSSTLLFSQATCDLQNLAYDIQQEGEEFYFVFGEPSAEVLRENYDVLINGDVYESDGKFYGPLQADCETNNVLEVRHRALEFCSFQASVGSVCYDSTACEIGEVEVSFPECNPNGVVMVTLDFKYENVSDSFTIQGNGKFYGEFAYADLPVIVGPVASDCHLEREFIIRDSAVEGCFSAVDGIVICCPVFCNRPEFEIVSQDCSEEFLFLKLKVLEGPAPTNITLQVNEEYVSEIEVDGDYIFAQVALPAAGELNTITLCSVGIADVCCATQVFPDVPCEPIDGCKIYEVRYELDECQAQEEVFLLLDFKHVNTESDTFFILVNGLDYGVFSYENLPVEVGPFESRCDAPYVLSIVDGSATSCVVEEEVFICCFGDCLEPIYEVVDLSCSDEEFRTKLQLIHPVSSELLVSLNGELIDYEYEFPYVYVAGRVDSFNAPNELTICTIALPNDACCYSQLIDLSECGSGEECKIGDLSVQPSACIDTGFPGFILDFDYANVGSEGFTVKGNGLDYGNFSYADLPVFLTVMDNCDIFYEFVVHDNELECFSVLEYGTYCCNDACSFRALEQRVRCEDGVLTEVAFFLEEETDPLKNYEVFVDGVLVGTSEENNVFLEFATEIELTGNQAPVLTICDSDCCVEYALDISDCDDVPPVECSIDGVSLAEVTCGVTGLDFVLDFEHQGTSAKEFDVFSIFGYFGTYSYDELPLQVSGFPSVNLGLNVLFICDKGSFCCQVHLFNAPLCFSAPDTGDEGALLRDAKGFHENEYKYIIQNPVDVSLELRSPVTENVYEIFSAAGQRVMKTKTSYKRASVDVSGLNAGLYVVKIENSMGIKLEKLIISK